jgi:hypothetical protein
MIEPFAKAKQAAWPQLKDCRFDNVNQVRSPGTVSISPDFVGPLMRSGAN